MAEEFLLGQETRFSSQLISKNCHIVFSHLRKYPPHLLACNWLANSLPTGLDGKGSCNSPALAWIHEKNQSRVLHSRDVALEGISYFTTSRPLLLSAITSCNLLRKCEAPNNPNKF